MRAALRLCEHPGLSELAGAPPQLRLVASNDNCIPDPARPAKSASRANLRLVEDVSPAETETRFKATSSSEFTGKEEDVEVGLQYFGKRYLNPLLGRWISADPLAVHAPGEADLNVYAYVKGSVLVVVDPLGLEGIVSAQITKEYPADARGTARKLAASQGVLKVGVHWKTHGLERQVVGKDVDRIDTLGHYASGLATARDGYALNPWMAERLAPYLRDDVKIVIHGCGKASGAFANTKQFLSKLGSKATLYTHRNRAGPGQPMNFVRHRLVDDGQGGKKLDSHLMDGKDKVIGEIFTEDYVKWWASKQDSKNLNKFLGDKEHYTVTDDVRKVFQDELDSRKGDDSSSNGSSSSYNGESGQSEGSNAESHAGTSPNQEEGNAQE